MCTVFAPTFSFSAPLPLSLSLPLSPSFRGIPNTFGYMVVVVGVVVIVLLGLFHSCSVGINYLIRKWLQFDYIYFRTHHIHITHWLHITIKTHFCCFIHENATLLCDCLPDVRQCAYECLNIY